MGILDFVRNAGAKIFGDKKPDEGEVYKPLREHVREHGINPDGIDFKMQGETVVVSGHVPDQTTREKVVLIVGNVEGVAHVDDRLMVGTTATGAAGGTGSAGAASTEWTSKTYTVAKGDTLSAIAKRMYGDASKYPKIFEANKPMLKDPDKIYPGQVLRIPN